MSDTQMLHDRFPTANALKTTVPIKEMMDRGETEQVIRKRIIYDYRPLYVIAFTVCFGIFVWAAAMVTVEISSNMTAQACFATGGDWKDGGQGVPECTRK